MSTTSTPGESSPARHRVPAKPGALTADAKTPTPSSPVLLDLLNSSIILAGEWERLPPETREELVHCADTKVVLSRLVQHRVLTEYQAARVEAGKTSGLILGNYRVMDRIGSGGMGIVFKAEHLRLRRQVAVKVLSLPPDPEPRLLQRFLGEIQAVAQLQHPNIVGALDAGEAASADPDAPTLHYFVMEYIPGEDLEQAVRAHGPFPPAEACGLVYQVAGALAEAHKHNLVHRDIKPSNIMVTPDGQAKVLDFGLVRRFDNRMTEPGTVLGTLDYLAPEQAHDPSAVDIRADIYGLGGTLLWCLTGRTPFPEEGAFADILFRRMTGPPPSLRARMPQAPAELDAVVTRMMARCREDRYPTPQAVMKALLGFLEPQSQESAVHPSLRKGPRQRPALPSDVDRTDRPQRVLVVDDSATSRRFCAYVLQEAGIPCDEVADGVQALRALASEPYDLVLVDWVMPDMTGLELCRKLREDSSLSQLKIFMFSAAVADDDVAQALAAGADDYLPKQFSPAQLAARVKAGLRLKAAQERTDSLNRQLLAMNRQLEQTLTARAGDLVHVRNALVLGLADLACCRDGKSGSHLQRLQRYCRCLAEEAMNFPSFPDPMDGAFIQMLECCAPLHDIGKVGLPDHILCKPGNLDPEERLIMQSHTTIGAEALQKIAKRHGPVVAFLQMAIDIARHHHERYDGRGYPDRLVGRAIPLAARIVTVCDVYDSLRTRQLYKPALSHAAALEVMLEASGGQFDPLLLRAFQRCAPLFERIFLELQDHAA